MILFLSSPRQLMAELSEADTEKGQFADAEPIQRKYLGTGTPLKPQGASRLDQYYELLAAIKEAQADKRFLDAYAPGNEMRGRVRFSRIRPLTCYSEWWAILDVLRTGE